MAHWHFRIVGEDDVIIEADTAVEAWQNLIDQRDADDLEVTINLEGEVNLPPGFADGEASEGVEEGD